MNTPAILALETGVPPLRYPQEAIAEEYIALQGQASRRARAIRAIFDRAGVGFRHMVIDDQYFRTPRSTQTRNDRYMEEALPLGEATIQRGLDAAGYRADEIDEFIVVSCTGISIPGLDLHLAARLGMRHDLQRTCVIGMGCYGAFPGLQRARHAVLATPGRLALVLSVELCSLHLQFGETSEDVVSSALFSDGAGMVLVGTPKPERDLRPTPQLLHSATYCDYTTLEHMSFHLTDQGFRMYLSSYVPELLAAQIRAFVDGMLAQCNLIIDDVRFWGVHPGSTKIIDHVQANLGLRDEQVEFSHQVLHDYGNMSSATILFVLDRIQRCGNPTPGDYGVLLAFGPGLTMEGMVVRW